MINRIFTPPSEVVVVDHVAGHASVDALEERHRVVDEKIDLSAFRDDVRSEPLKRLLVCKVADEPRTVLHVDHVNRRALAREALGDAFALLTWPC